MMTPRKSPSRSPLAIAPLRRTVLAGLAYLLLPGPAPAQAPPPKPPYKCRTPKSQARLVELNTKLIPAQQKLLDDLNATLDRLVSERTDIAMMMGSDIKQRLRDKDAEIAATKKSIDAAEAKLVALMAERDRLAAMDPCLLPPSSPNKTSPAPSGSPGGEEPKH